MSIESVLHFISRRINPAWNIHHVDAMQVAKSTYDGSLPITQEQWSGEGYVAYSVATRERVAWEAYFDRMLELDEDPWTGYHKFNKEITRYAKSTHA